MIKPPDYYRQLSEVCCSTRTWSGTRNIRCSTNALPKVSRKREACLYPVTILEDDRSRFKVHYVGYSDLYDEWKDYSDVEELDVDAEIDANPFSLHGELANRIKATLKSGRKEL